MYPSRMSPRAKPEYGDPTILETWGPTHDPPTSSLPGNAAVEIVKSPTTKRTAWRCEPMMSIPTT